MGAKLDVTAVTRWLEDEEKSLDKSLSEGVDNAALRIASEAKARTPVRTGNLRDSITAALSGPGAVVEVGAGYAAFVERRNPFFDTGDQENILSEEVAKSI